MSKQKRDNDCRGFQLEWTEKFAFVEETDFLVQWRSHEGGGSYNSPTEPQITSYLLLFQVFILRTRSFIIWFCNCHNNKNYVALFPKSYSLPLCLMNQ